MQQLQACTFVNQYSEIEGSGTQDSNVLCKSVFLKNAIAFLQCNKKTNRCPFRSMCMFLNVF